MSDQFSNRDFESPVSNVIAFYKKLMRQWLHYGIAYVFGYVDGSRQKPAIVLRCGKKETYVDVKTAFLLRYALRQEPELLNQFLDDWLVTKEGEPLMTSGAAVPKRKVAKRTPSKPVSTQVTDNIEGAIEQVFD